jgi:hypothetical protein
MNARSPLPSLCVFIATAMLRFAPSLQPVRARLGGPWIDILLLISMLALIYYFTRWMFADAEKEVLRRRANRAHIDALGSLSRDECAILGVCVLQDQPTIFVPPGDPAAHTLCQKGLLVQATAQGNFAVPESAWPMVKRALRDLGAAPEDPYLSERMTRLIDAQRNAHAFDSH